MITPPRKPALNKTGDTIDDRTQLPDWMMFPSLNEAWKRSADDLITLMAERIKTFDALAASAPPAERAQARLIAQSYARVHAVLQELNATCKKTPSTERRTT
jgi:hypothetical protein